MFMNRMVLTIATVGFVFATVGCSKTEPPTGQAVSLSEPAASPAGVGFTAPEGWIQEAPKSQMRHSQYRLPGEAGDAEVAVFANIGGSAQQNVDRWIGQFSSEDGDPVDDQAKTETKTLGAFQLTLVDVTGVYNPGMGAPMAGGAEPKSGYRLLGAVIEGGQGRPWFVKLTGPIETVAKWESSFTSFVGSVAD